MASTKLPYDPHHLTAKLAPIYSEVVDFWSMPRKPSWRPTRNRTTLAFVFARAQSTVAYELFYTSPPHNCHRAVSHEKVLLHLTVPASSSTLVILPVKMPPTHAADAGHRCVQARWCTIPMRALRYLPWAAYKRALKSNYHLSSTANRRTINDGASHLAV